VTPGLIQGQRHAKGKTVLPPSSLVECDSRANDSNALVRVTETTAPQIQYPLIPTSSRRVNIATPNHPPNRLKAT
jgi:hypothetical protein